jgi:hypothetical protein
MIPAPQYAVLLKGEWHICHLVLATEFMQTDTHWSDTPVWCEVKTSAFIGPYYDAEYVIPLKGPTL